MTAWRDITANRQIVVDRAVQGGAFGPVGRYLDILWTDSMGRAVVGLGVAGAACMAIVAPARAALLFLFPLAFFLFITNTAPASRYLNPVLPFLAIAAAWMIDYIAQVSRAPRAAVWLVVGACAVSPLIHSIRTDAFFRTDDTRALARRFVESRIPAGASILVQPVLGSADDVAGGPDRGTGAESGKRRRRVNEVSNPAQPRSVSRAGLPGDLAWTRWPGRRKDLCRPCRAGETGGNGGAETPGRGVRYP